MASPGQLTVGIAPQIKNPLNFVNNFAGLSVELLDELKTIAEPGFTALDAEARGEIEGAGGLILDNARSQATQLNQFPRRPPGSLKGQNRPICAEVSSDPSAANETTVPVSRTT
jgi:hypothetical protein